MKTIYEIPQEIRDAYDIIFDHEDNKYFISQVTEYNDEESDVFTCIFSPTITEEDGSIRLEKDENSILLVNKEIMGYKCIIISIGK